MGDLVFYIYDDYGSAAFSVKELENCIRKYFSRSKIERVNGSDIINGKLDDLENYSNYVLCIGGGFDLGYLKSLTITGCEKIKRFVENGGYYIGICAGAYFASDYLEFDLNGPLEVKGERYLNFFNGKTVGPINKNFKYNSDDYALATKIELLTDIKFKQLQYVYVNGGCYFSPNNTDNIEILARYSLNKEIAICKCKFGKGKCLLSGVHFEFDASNLDSNNHNIKNNLLEVLKSNESSKSDLNNSIFHSNDFLIKYLLDDFFETYYN